MTIIILDDHLTVHLRALLHSDRQALHLCLRDAGVEPLWMAHTYRIHGNGSPLPLEMDPMTRNWFAQLFAVEALLTQTGGIPE